MAGRSTNAPARNPSGAKGSSSTGRCGTATTVLGAVLSSSLASARAARAGGFGAVAGLAPGFGGADAGAAGAFSLAAACSAASVGVSTSGGGRSGPSWVDAAPARLGLVFDLDFDLTLVETKPVLPALGPTMVPKRVTG